MGESGMLVPLLVVATCFLGPFVSKCSLGLDTFSLIVMCKSPISTTDPHPLSGRGARLDG